MLEICRTCGAICSENSKAKNLFDEDHTILLHQIEVLTGLWLQYAPYMPSFICAQCELDLNIAITYRERCLSTQKYLNRMESKAATKLSTSEEVVHVTIMRMMDHAADETTSDPDSDSQYLTHLDKSKTGVPDSGELHCISDIDDSDNDDQEIEAPDEWFTIESDGKEDKADPGVVPPVRALEKRKRTKHQRNYVCDQCGKNFTDRSNFKVHLLRHTGVRNYHCKICNSSFFTSYLLKRHELTHDKSIKYGCRFCGKQLSNLTTRLRHERTHTNERLFPCSFCEKSFPTAAQLKDHELVHTGIRKYSCQLCDQRFLRRTHLVTHFRSKTHKNNEQTHGKKL